MKKKEYIERYGEERYEKRLLQNRELYKKHHEQRQRSNREWRREHREEWLAQKREWRRSNPEKVKANHREEDRKGGIYYKKRLINARTGLQGERNKIRMKHRFHYRSYKKIIAPESQIHHEWIPNTPNYRGIALVEADPHRHGIIDPILILEGEITLLTEAEIRGDK